MSSVPRITTMLQCLGRSELDDLPPVERRRFADWCRHWANEADKAPQPKSGVLSDLRGQREEWR